VEELKNKGKKINDVVLVKVNSLWFRVQSVRKTGNKSKLAMDGLRKKVLQFY
jgi:hypothetical protein